MAQSHSEQEAPPYNEEPGHGREALEQAARLAEQAAQSRVMREDAQRITRSTASVRRNDVEPQRALGAQDEITRLKQELEQTQNMGMRFAATAIRLGNEINVFKSDLQLTRERMQEAAKLDEALAAAKAETECVRTELDAVSRDTEQRIEALTLQLAETEARAQQEVAQLTAWQGNEAQGLRTEVGRLQEALARAVQRVDELDGSLGKAVQRSTELEAGQAAAKRRVSDLEQEFVRLSDASTRAETACENAERQSTQAQTELESMYTAARCEYELLQSQQEARQQEAQAALAAANGQLAGLAAELAVIRDSSDTVRQDEQLIMHLRAELERTLQECTDLRDERSAVVYDLERAHAALQEKDRALNDVLMLIDVTESAVKVTELEPRSIHDPQRKRAMVGGTQGSRATSPVRSAPRDLGG